MKSVYLWVGLALAFSQTVLAEAGGIEVRMPEMRAGEIGRGAVEIPIGMPGGEGEQFRPMSFAGAQPPSLAADNQVWIYSDNYPFSSTGEGYVRARVVGFESGQFTVEDLDHEKGHWEIAQGAYYSGRFIVDQTSAFLFNKPSLKMPANVWYFNGSETVECQVLGENILGTLLLKALSNHTILKDGRIYNKSAGALYTAKIGSTDLFMPNAESKNVWYDNGSSVVKCAVVSSNSRWTVIRALSDHIGMGGRVAREGKLYRLSSLNTPNVFEVVQVSSLGTVDLGRGAFSVVVAAQNQNGEAIVMAVQDHNLPSPTDARSSVRGLKGSSYRVPVANIGGFSR